VTHRNVLWPKVVTPDVYPRDREPLPDPASGLPMPAVGAPAPLRPGIGWARPPTRKPVVYRRFINYGLAVGPVAVPLLPQQAETESIVVQVTSAAANPVFVGDQGVTVANGQRVNPGQLLTIEEDNRRYQVELVEELQLVQELLATMGGSAPPRPAYYNDRVVLNPNDYYVVANVARTVTVTLYYPPERV